MACSSNASHAYIQYVSDKEKEIVSVSKFIKCNLQTITPGKIVQVQWLNEQTGVQDIYEAYIHFLGSKYFPFNLHMWIIVMKLQIFLL